MAEKKKVTKRKKITTNVDKGIVHINATFNNTLVNVTDVDGNVIVWSSGGAVGYKGNKKKTQYVAGQVAEAAARAAKEHGMKSVEVHVKGPGLGRETAIRALQNVDLEVTLIRDVSPIPHNGCRPPKKRRI